MNRAARRWPVIAFAYAVVVPVGTSLGPLLLGVPGDVPGPEPPLVLFWAIGVGTGATVLTARGTAGGESVQVADLLPSMVAGVSIAFGGIQLAWGTYSIVAQVLGTLALGGVVVGCLLGGRIAGRGRIEGGSRADLRAGAAVVLALSFATSTGGALPYWLQGSPVVAGAGRTLLLVACPVAGWLAARWDAIRVRTLVPLLTALPFLVPVTGVVVGPLAVLFDRPPGTLLSVDPRSVALAVPVAALVAVGAVFGRGVAVVARRSR